MEILLEENPILGEFPLTNPGYGYGYPTRRKTAKRRNPLKGITSIIPKNYLQGVQVAQIVAATGGFWVAAWGSQQIVKTTGTGNQKLLKLGSGAGLAIVAGMLAAVVNKSTASAAVLGGLANVLVQGLEMFTDIRIGGGAPRALPPGRPGGGGGGGVTGRWPGASNQSEFAGVRLQ